MSALHRLKAYFGMIPADDLDDYGTDYRDDYRRDEYHSGYDRAYQSGGYQSSAHEAGAPEPGGYETERGNPVRERSYATVRRPGRAEFDSYHDDYPPEPSALAAPRVHNARRPTWAPQAPVRGSLAVDTASPVREPQAREPVTPPRTGLFAEEAEGEAHPLARIVTLHPHNYSEARPIGERYREGAPVIMNLTGMDDKDAKRLVDFAAGLAFALRGSIDKVTNKVFLLSPPNVDVSAEDRRRIAEGGLFNQS